LRFRWLLEVTADCAARRFMGLQERLRTYKKMLMLNGLW
jgi:hypothetical protein